MDTLIKQTRRREKKLPARKSISFKEDKKKPSNWLEKQFSRQMSGQSYDPIGDMDHAAAVAATAYAISTSEETWLESYHRGASSSRSMSRREDEFPSEEPRSLSRRFSGQLAFRDSEMKDPKHPTLKSPKRKSSSLKKTFSINLKEDQTKQNKDSEEKHDRQRKPVPEPPVRTRSERRVPAPPPPPPPLSPPPLRLPPRDIKSSGHASRKDDTRADAWEKAELAKIKAKYEKLNRKIDMWEAKKRDKARRKLDIAESELEQRRKKGLQRFREDTEYIEQIAAGARAQAEKERQSKEFKVKEKASVIRSTGKIPGKTCCF